MGSTDHSEAAARLESTNVKVATTLPDKNGGVNVQLIHLDSAKDEVQTIAAAIGGTHTKGIRGYSEYITKDKYDSIIDDYTKNNPVRAAARTRIPHHDVERAAAQIAAIPMAQRKWVKRHSHATCNAAL